MGSISLDLPASVSDADARLYLAMKLYEVGRMSSGQAAKSAGYSKRAFLELLGKHGVAVFDHPVDELGDDLKHA